MPIYNILQLSNSHSSLITLDMSPRVRAWCQMPTVHMPVVYMHTVHMPVVHMPVAGRLRREQDFSKSIMYFDHFLSPFPTPPSSSGPIHLLILLFQNKKVGGQ